MELERRNREVLHQSQKLRELSHRLIRIQDDERRHIARELHDSAGQILAALGMNLATVVRNAKLNAPELARLVEESEQMVRELSQEIRTTSYLLHPPLLDECGLSESLLWYIRGLKERSGLEVTLAIPDDFGRLTPEMELVIFRIVQECLTNVHRHSGSRVAAIEIERGSGNIILSVQDEGAAYLRKNFSKLSRKAEEWAFAECVNVCSNVAVRWRSSPALGHENFSQFSGC